MGRMTEDTKDQSLQALVRPGSLDVVGQQTELFPFDAFNFETYDGKSGVPKVSLKDNWKFDPETIESYSLSVAQITAEKDTPHIDGETDIENEDDQIFDGGSHPITDDDEIYNDNTETNDTSRMPENTIAIESPVLFKKGVAGDVQSLDFEEGSKGWKIWKDGDVEFNNGVFRGSLDAASGIFSGDLDAARGTFSGTLIAASGEFEGQLKTATIETEPGNQTEEVNQTEESDIYQANDFFRNIHCNNSFQQDGFISATSTTYTNAKYVLVSTRIYFAVDINDDMREWTVGLYDSEYSLIDNCKSRCNNPYSGFEPSVCSDMRDSAFEHRSGESFGQTTQISVYSGGDELYIKGLPQSSSGLSSGRIWHDTTDDTLKIIP